MDLAFRPDVDSTRRIEAEHHAESGGQPPGHGDLLLVAAAQAPDLALRARIDGQARDGLGGPPALCTRIDRTPIPGSAIKRQGDVFPHRSLRKQRVRAIGWHEHDPGADRIVRRARNEVLPGNRDPAAVPAAVPGQALEEDVLSLTFERRNAEDLARVECERDRVKHAATREALDL